MTLHFLRELDQLYLHLTEIGNMIEAQVDLAFKAVITLDEATARRVIKGDDEIDDVEIRLEEECLKLLALYQPVAGDLRLIIAILKINNDLERIGDHAKNLAETAINLSSHSSPIEFPENLARIFKQVKLMLRKTLLAFIEQDQKLAQTVLEMDDQVDEMCAAELPRQIQLIKDNPELAGDRLMLLSVCRQLERIGDHASNIAEDVVYLLSGDIIRHYSSEDITKLSS